jgi:hypothetical protein
VILFLFLYEIFRTGLTETEFGHFVIFDKTESFDIPMIDDFKTKK